MELTLKIAWFVLVYLLGSVPFGLVLGRVFCRIDVRRAGSGNVGATNVARLCGTGWGIATLLLDALKGVAPVAVALYVLPAYWPEVFPLKTLPTLVCFTGLAAILGHLYSIFLKFKGGKAVATTVGVYLVILPVHLIIAAAACLYVIKRSGYVSLGSLTLVVTMPVLLILSGMFTRNFDYIIMAAGIAVLVIFSHRGNIVRLLAGEEKPWQKRDTPEGTENAELPPKLGPSGQKPSAPAGPVCPPPEFTAATKAAAEESEKQGS